MNQTFRAVVAAFAGIISRDDVAIGLTGAALCTMSLSMFFGVFSDLL